MDDEDLYGAAHWALLKAGIDVCEPADPIAIARGLDVDVIVSDARGVCGAFAMNDPAVIVVRRRRDVRAEAFALAHELGHYAIARTGALESHTERDADEVAMRLLVPRGWVRVECLTRGRGIEELPALCPHVDPRVVIARARHVLGLQVAIDDAA